MKSNWNLSVNLIMNIDYVIYRNLSIIIIMSIEPKN